MSLKLPIPVAAEEDPAEAPGPVAPPREQARDWPCVHRPWLKYRLDRF
jgi:hypothetical protein